MEWGEWGTLIVVIAGAIGALMRMHKDPAYTPEIRRSTNGVIVVFLVYVALGVVVALALPVDALSPVTLGFMVLALVTYLIYGSLWVLRLTPSKRPPPAWVLKPFTQLDSLFYLVFVIGVLGTAWGMLR